MAISTDILIIGSGITGLSAAWHLERFGMEKLLLSAAQDGVTALSAGLLSGGQLDNFTRVSHAHGETFAKELWRFGDIAFDRLLDFCQDQQVPVAVGGRLRLIASEDEWVESQQAVTQMQAAGWPTQLRRLAQEDRTALGIGTRILAIQDDGFRGGYTDPQALMAALSRGVQCQRIPAVASMVTSPSGIQATLTTGETVTAEMAIVAAHLAIGALVPNLREALVSVADQWHSVTFSPQPQDPGGTASSLHSARTNRLLNKPGLVFTAHHGYEWGVTLPKQGKARIGGGRFLRPLAGFEAKQATSDGKITAYLTKKFHENFTEISAQAETTSYASLDCRPCDELPIIGPMFGDPRVLVGTGYMGAGLTMGFMAGLCLAELVCKGKSPKLPRRLWPERLRSLVG